MTDQPLDPTDAFAELGRIRLGDTDLPGVLHQVAELAKRTIAGVEEVSVTLIRGVDARTVAFSGELALALDEWQYHEGGGPCLDAAATAGTVSVPDLATERRWPGYVPHALGTGMRSCLSVGLPVHEEVTGALNLYATRPAAFDEDAVTLAQTFSGYAAIALANAHLYDATTSLARHMQAAMAHRALIEQAKGVLMAGRRCSAEEAFKIMSRLSQDTNRKLRDIAAEVVEDARQAGGEQLPQ